MTIENISQSIFTNECCRTWQWERYSNKQRKQMRAKENWKGERGMWLGERKRCSNKQRSHGEGLVGMKFNYPVNTIKVMLSWPVYLTTLFSWAGLVLYADNQHLRIFFLPETDNCFSWISRRERMTIENISWSIFTNECCKTRSDQTSDLLITSQMHICLSHQGWLKGMGAREGCSNNPINWRNWEGRNLFQ